MGCVKSNQGNSTIKTSSDQKKPKESIADPIRNFYKEYENSMPNRIKELFHTYFNGQAKLPFMIDLKFINLSNNHFTPLEVILPKFPELRRLNLWKTSLRNEGCIKLCETLINFPNLTFLSLADNGISLPGIQALTRQFVNLGSLEFLELHINTFQLQCCELLSANFIHLVQLKRITLDECELSGEGLEKIIKSLPDMKKLENISLDYNMFGERSSLLIAMVNKLKNLKRISLQHSEITGVTQEALGKVYPDIIFSL